MTRSYNDYSIIIKLNESYNTREKQGSTTWPHKTATSSSKKESCIRKGLDYKKRTLRKSNSCIIRSCIAADNMALVFFIHNLLVVCIFEVRWKPETVKSR
mgnify:CR=1 FL=1